jgi:hypothetical protein
VARARGAIDGQTPEQRPADHHRAGSKGERLEHVGAPAHASVDDHLEPVADGVDDCRQRVGGRQHRVELAPAVV